MQSVAVLNTVCRRWKASLLLIDAQVASFSFASQALISDSVAARDAPSSVVDYRSIGTTSYATTHTVRNDLTSSLLTLHWSKGDRRQVIAWHRFHNICFTTIYYSWTASLTANSIAVLYHSSEASSKYPPPCLLAEPRAARQTPSLCTSHAFRQADR